MSTSVLEEYIETGNFQDLDLLLSKDPQLVNKKTSQEISALLLACYYRKPQIIEVILKHITTITIHEACAVGLKDHVQMMIDYKKDIVDELSTHGFTPLGIATHFNHEDIVGLLLKHHADPNISSQNGFNVFPLHASVSANNTSISRMLLEAGAEVNIFQQGNMTPLHFAAQHGNIDLIILLLEKGADIHAITSTGDTASMIASSKGYHELASILQIN